MHMIAGLLRCPIIPVQVHPTAKRHGPVLEAVDGSTPDSQDPDYEFLGFFQRRR
jgi:hypothetical protein